MRRETGGPRERIVVGLAVVVMAAACGGGGSETATGTTKVDAVSTPSTTIDPGPRAAARWEDVTTLTGTGPADAAPFTIAAGAIQWKMNWSCDSGNLAISSTPAPKKPGPLVTASCPGKGEQFSITTGDVRLRVDATGPWEAKIQQQIDTPIAEPPLPGTDSAPVLGAGDFHNIERSGSGTARLYQLAGQRVLRLDPFDVSPNTELYVWLSEAQNPTTSAEVVAAPYVQLASLKSTVGTQNYVLPDDLPTSKLGSVVIWCAPVRIAYIAAPLTGP
jgi:hypothetical protein